MSQFAKIFEAVKNKESDAEKTPDKDKLSPIKTASQKPQSQRRVVPDSSGASIGKTIPGKSKEEVEATRSSANQKKQSTALLDAKTINSAAKDSSAGKDSFPDAVKHKIIGKSRHPDYTQVLAYIRKDTHRAVKKILIDDPLGRDLSDLAEELFAKWLKQAQNG